MSENRRLLAVKKNGDTMPVCVSLKLAEIDGNQLVVWKCGFSRAE